MNNKGIGLVEIILGIALAVVIIILLAGCEVEPENVSPTISTVQIEYSDFNLVVDSKTKIVYIDNIVKFHNPNASNQVSHVYTPYYSENGRLCKFDDGVVKEVEE